MFNRERFAQMQAIDEAVVRDDKDGFLHEIRESGFLPAHRARRRGSPLRLVQVVHAPRLAEQPFEFTPQFAAEILRTTTDPRSPYADVLRQLNLPPDYLLLNRIQWGLNSVLGRLRARNNWRGIRDEYIVDDAPPATRLGELDQAWWADHGRNT